MPFVSVEVGASLVIVVLVFFISLILIAHGWVCTFCAMVR